MNREIHRYSFEASVPASEIEETLLLAVLAAEGLYGQSRVRLDATYYFDAESRACVIDAGSDVGRDISRIFAGFALREFAGAAFCVRCMNGAVGSKDAPTGNEKTLRPGRETQGVQGSRCVGCQGSNDDR